MILKSIRFYKSESSEEGIWLTIYSDMMTNLMLFFLLLFGMSRMPDEMRAKVAEGVESNFRSEHTDRNLKQVLKKFREEEAVFQVKEVIEQTELQTFTKVEINEDIIKLTLRSPMLFRPGQAVITSKKARGFLRELATILNGLPNDVIVGGHTDNIPVSSGKYKNNWELSIDRALNVERILERYGVDPKRLIVAGYAEHMPLYPNDTPESRAFNRRIEIDVVR